MKLDHHDIISRLKAIDEVAARLQKFPATEQSLCQNRVNMAIMLVRHEIISWIRELRQSAGEYTPSNLTTEKGAE